LYPSNASKLSKTLKGNEGNEEEVLENLSLCPLLQRPYSPTHHHHPANIILHPPFTTPM